MTILKINNFTGMIPRLPAERLPDGAARYAENCDFAYGELRSLKGPAPRITTTNPVRSLFTDDGLRFYAWDVPTRAYLAPTIDDTFNRVYFNSEGQGLKVAQMNGAYLALSNPRPPVASWNVGVARPTVAPQVTSAGTVAWGQDVGATPRITAICRLAGAEVKRQVATIVTTTTAWQDYTVSLNGFSCGADGGAAATPTPIAPIDGWIEGPDSAIVYLRNNVYESGDVGDLLYAKGANFIAPGLWRINSSGTLQLRQGTAMIFPSFMFGLSVEGVQYKNKLYSDLSNLFAAMEDGTATTPAPSTDAAQAASASELTGLFEVVGTDGTVLFSTDVALTASGDNFNVAVSYGQGDTITVAYVTTFENIWGEESAPSDPVTIEVLPYQSVTVLQTYTPLVGGQDIQGMNLYRTYPGNNAEYIKSNTIPITAKVGEQWSAIDGTSAPVTSTILVTQEWDTPPSNLHSLTYAGNGFFAGASGKDLRFSEPYRPHAWPYFMTFPNAIVGIVEVEGGLLVTTTAQPYLVYGAHPEQMSQQTINAEQAGVSSRSMARVRGSAIFASNDGLVSVSGGQASLDSSHQLFTREDWRNRYKTGFRNMHLGAWDGHMIGVIDPSYPGEVSPQENFILRMDEAPGFARFNITGQTILASAISATTDEFYLLYSNGFAEFGIGADLPIVWHSKTYEYPRVVSFGAAIAKYSGTLSIVLTDVDRTVSHTTVLPPAQTEHHFRLPSLSPSKRWEVSILGTGSVQYLEFGASFAELQNG